MESALTSLFSVIFFVSLLICGGFGLFYAYHWMRYSANPAMTFLSLTVYAGGCILLLVTMLGAIAAL